MLEHQRINHILEIYNHLRHIYRNKLKTKPEQKTRRYKWWSYPKGKFTRGCSIYFVAVGSWTQQPASSPTFHRHSEQHPDQRINSGQTTTASRRRSSINQIHNQKPRASNARQQCVPFRYTFGLNLTVTQTFSTYGNIIFDKMLLGI